MTAESKFNWWFWQIIIYLFSLCLLLIGVVVLWKERLVFEKYNLIISLSENETIIYSGLFIICGVALLNYSIKAHLKQMNKQ